jgi:hypothetical protein
MNQTETVKTGTMGLGASFFTWLVGAFKWYAGNLQTITDWLVHIAQLGGMVVMVLSVMILWRNWKTGKNSANPKD